MNERGEISLICTLLIFVCMGVVLLCGLELTKSFKLLKVRTELFLCLKETKGEIHHYMKFMGRTNWGIRNLNRASLVLMFIPGAQKASLDAQKLKKLLKKTQEIRLLSYLNSLRRIRARGCPIDPTVFMSPFKMQGFTYQRDKDGGALLRKNKWAYHFFSKPYFLQMSINAFSYERPQPHITYHSLEKGVPLSSLLSSH